MGGILLLTRLKGVMTMKSSNRYDDLVLVTCGGEDNGKIRVWHILERATINEIGSIHEDYRQAAYNLNMIYFNDGTDEQDQSNKVMLMLVVGMRQLSIYALNMRSFDLGFIEQIEFEEGSVGTFHQYSSMVRLDLHNYALLVAADGKAHVFKLRLQSSFRPLANF